MRVPVYERQVDAEPLPEVRQRVGVDANNFLGGTGRVLAGTAEDVAGGFNHAVAEIYSKQLEEANQTRVQDTINQFELSRQNALFDPKQGAFAQKGAAVFSQENSKPLTDNVLDGLTQTASSLADNLGNEQQKAMFNQHVQQSLLQTRGQLIQHEGEQYRVYRAGVNEAAAATAVQGMQLNYNSPDLLKQYVGQIHAAHADLAGLQGLPVEAGAVKSKAVVSGALSNAFDAALLQNDHASATRILQQFSPELDTNDMFKMYGKLQAVNDAHAAYAIGNGIMDGIAPLMQTSPSDQAWNLVEQGESGGQHFAADGSVLTSPAGAKGVAQVMPETAPEAAKLAGLPWLPEVYNRGVTGDMAKDKEAEQYNRALGKAYFNEQLRAFHGDTRLAFAAYNAGAGAVREALDKSIKEGGNWLKFLPAETQQYVTAKQNALAAGEGQYKRPTLADVVQVTNQNIDQQYGESASPDLRKQILANVTQAYELQTQAIKQRDDEGVAEAYRQLQQNGGNYASLPVAVKSAIPPTKVDEVMAFGKKLAKGLEPETDWKRWTELMGDRTLLAKTNLFAERNRFSDEQYKQLVERQTGQKQPEAATRIQSNDAILRDMAHQAGIDTEARFSNGRLQNKDSFKQFGALQSQFIEKIRLAEQDRGGKPLTEDEVRKVAAGVFTPVHISPTGLFNDKDIAVGLLTPEQVKDVEVPEAERAAIVSRWQTLRGGVPSEDQVREVYLQRLRGG